MVYMQKIRNFGFSLKKQLNRSPAIGSLTDLVGLHTSRVGRVKNVISARELQNPSDYGIQYHLIRNNSAITRPKPQTLEETVHSAFEYSYTCKASEYYSLEIKDGYVMTENGWVLTANRNFLVESLFKPEIFETKKVNEITFWPKVERVPGKLVLAYKGWSLNNYYHWMLEFLPKISVLLDSDNKSFSELFEDARILLPYKPSRWMMQSLQMIGIDQGKLFHTTSKQLQVDRLIFIPEFGTLYSLPAWAVDWLRKSFAAYMKPLASSNKRIYVSREKAATRHVQNEDQVIQMLSHYGFQKVVLEEMDLADQIALFSQAEIIVGPHGAGFSNIVFSKGATLIDIFEPGHVNCCFYMLCHDFGHNYWYVMSETIEDVDILVDINKLERTLEQALEQCSCPESRELSKNEDYAKN